MSREVMGFCTECGKPVNMCECHGEDFVKNLMNNQKDLDPKIRREVSEKIWEIICNN